MNIFRTSNHGNTVVTREGSSVFLSFMSFLMITVILNLGFGLNDYPTTHDKAVTKSSNLKHLRLN